MFGIFETGGRGHKFQAFNRDTFASIEDALAVIPSVVFHELDGEDAADVLTRGGMVYAIERINDPPNRLPPNPPRRPIVGLVSAGYIDLDFSAVFGAGMTDQGAYHLDTEEYSDEEIDLYLDLITPKDWFVVEFEDRDFQS